MFDTEMDRLWMSEESMAEAFNSDIKHSKSQFHIIRASIIGKVRQTMLYISKRK